ncbi:MULTISPECIES: hypothetical protein [unclassified Streptomyces]|uniref:hypothetical protein n=1 Tax=unclassified Streptomyces TaxID=2593676 RepID=UPI00081E4825|nr:MULTISPECIES: hypothetical protein [unclassified Streptomyces]MYR95486.1 hypothetical protein [Streptomyces sp. SID4937]SCD91343.1 hypothetical protein GA0115243_104777 [Streptomyces sp. ScaeMP-e83]
MYDGRCLHGYNDEGPSPERCPEPLAPLLHYCLPHAREEDPNFSDEEYAILLTVAALPRVRLESEDRCIYMENIGQPDKFRCPRRKGVYLMYCSPHMLEIDSEWTEEKHRVWIEHVDRMKRVQEAEADGKVIHLARWQAEKGKEG